jgi:hypothetical protein
MLMWSGAFLAVTAELGVGGTAVVAVVGVGVGLLLLPVGRGAVSIGRILRKRGLGSRDKERDLTVV